MKKTVYILAAVLFITFSSCNTTERILKSNDSNLKYTKAIEWYNKGQYFKSIPVFEELMGLYKGEKSTEEIYFYYCMAQFKQKNYLISAFHFKNFTQKHPFSKYTEEALYMHAESYRKQTLDVALDQTETTNAIDAYQTFINTYPSSSRLSEANTQIDLLREKLEQKSISAAELYYKTKNYRAAAISFKNLLLDYPDVDNIENIQFKIVKSYFLYASQSIASKQMERFKESIKAAANFEKRYQGSKHTTQVQKLKENAHFEIIKSNYINAMSSSLDKRKDILSNMQEVYDNNNDKIKDESQKLQAKTFLEKAYFQQIKTNYLLAQETKIEKKASQYKKTIEAFNIFRSKYASSRFLNEAERLFLASEKNFKKYSNG